MECLRIVWFNIRCVQVELVKLNMKFLHHFANNCVKTFSYQLKGIAAYALNLVLTLRAVSFAKW